MPRVIPRPYQKKAVKLISGGFAAGHKSWLECDETGLGKSGISLLIAKNVMKENPYKLVLILCPAFGRPKWVREIEKWLPGKRSWSIIIKSYSEVTDPSMLQFLTSHRYGLLIIDESHYLNNFEAQRTQAVYGAPGFHGYTPLIKVCRQSLALTATPLPNGRVGEIYPWMWATKHPGLKGLTQDTFIKKWAAYHWKGFKGTMHKGVSDAAGLKEILHSRMIRRKKQDVLKELPPATRDVVMIPCTTKIFKEEQMFLKELLENCNYSPDQIQALLQNPDALQTILQSAPSFEFISLFRKQHGLFKVKAVMKYMIDNVLPETQKIAILCYHKDVAESYQKEFTKALKKLKLTVPITVVSGAVPADDRLVILDKADADDSHILIATMGSIKETFDLVNFPNSYFVEQDWKPGTHNQVEGRFLRFQSKLAVFWYYFVYDKGIDLHMFNTVTDKAKTIKAVVG
jgi:SNF2 family DNA or RNA helicase